MIATLLKFIKFPIKKESALEKARNAFQAEKHRRLTIHDLSILLKIDEFTAWNIVDELIKRNIIEFTGLRTIISCTGENINDLASYKLVYS